MQHSGIPAASEACNALQLGTHATMIKVFMIVCVCCFSPQAVGGMTHVHTLHHASILHPCCLAVCKRLCFVWHCKLSALGYKSVILDTLFTLFINLEVMCIAPLNDVIFTMSMQDIAISPFMYSLMQRSCNLSL